MKLILSRKGFDSSSGGVPSPIFPDGSMISLPIPDKSSSILYEDIHQGEYNLGKIVGDLTGNAINKNYKAHLDPDLNFENYPRFENWKPLFGQVNSAQGHLRNQHIDEGDIFLFYGLFRGVEIINNKIKYTSNSSPKHVIWGWLQIDKILPVDNVDKNIMNWALYHPHFNRARYKSNTLYIAKDFLDFKESRNNSINGAGIFCHFNEKLLLTDPTINKTSTWKLPQWFYPSVNKPLLTYHNNMDRWSKTENHILLKTVGRGQEFVLDCNNYPEAYKWVSDLIYRV